MSKWISKPLGTEVIVERSLWRMPKSVETSYKVAAKSNSIVSTYFNFELCITARINAVKHPHAVWSYEQLRKANDQP